MIKILQKGETKQSFIDAIRKGKDVSPMWKDIENVVNRFDHLKEIVAA